MKKILWYIIIFMLMCFETQNIFHSYLQTLYEMNR